MAYKKYMQKHKCEVCFDAKQSQYITMKANKKDITKSEFIRRSIDAIMALEKIFKNYGLKGF